MPILTLLIVLALIGFCVWLVLTYIPMPEPIKRTIVVVVVLLIVLWVASMLLGGGPTLPVR